VSQPGDQPILDYEPGDGPILDYASPRTRKPLRLAAASIIEVKRVPVPGGADVVEMLSGKGRAVSAVAFAAGSTAVMGVCIDRTLAIGFFGVVGNAVLVGFCAFFAVLVAMLSVLVIDATWRKTVLEIRPASLALIRSSPFKKRTNRWSRQEIHNVLVAADTDAATDRLVHELQLHTTTHSVVVLFDGHEAAELDIIARLIRQHVLGSDLVSQ